MIEAQFGRRWVCAILAQAHLPPPIVLSFCLVGGAHGRAVRAASGVRAGGRGDKA